MTGGLQASDDEGQNPRGTPAQDCDPNIQRQWVQIRAGVPGDDLRGVWPFRSVLFMSKRKGRKSITVTIKMLELLGRQDSPPDLAALPTRSSTSFDPTKHQLILAPLITWGQFGDCRCIECRRRLGGKGIKV